MSSQIDGILSHWGLQDKEITQIYNTAWQIGDEYVLKVYQNLQLLTRNQAMLQVLGEQKIPVGQVIPTLEHALYVADGSVYYFLSKKLPGSKVAAFSNIKSLAWDMGQAIARLHKAFLACEGMEGLWDNSLLDEMNGWVKKQLERTGWSSISREEYERLVSKLADLYGQLPKQLIHRDIHLGNFLFAEGEFSGYIDFDLSQRNIRIFDLCYFLAGLLSKEEGYGLTQEQWFVFVEQVFAGYSSAVPAGQGETFGEEESALQLSDAEKEAAPYVMECIELLCAAYFEKIHDTACAEDACRIYGFIKAREKRILEILFHLPKPVV